jgi:hypothetical protein
MAIPLVEAEEVRTGRGGGKTKGEKYGKYAVAIQKHVEWIKEAVGQSKDGTIRVKAADFAKEMGPDFAKRNPTSIYWGLKYVLFNEGIVVDTGTHKSGDKLLIMRLGTEEDKLPPSLSKYLEPDEEPAEPMNE